MYDIIVAVDKNFGIGSNGHMPWHCPEELELFRQKTRYSIIIVGRKTAENLPKLKDRIVFCISRNPHLNTASYNNECEIFTSLEEALEYSSISYPEHKVFVAGGGEIYNKCMFGDLIRKIDRIHLSIIDDCVEKKECDVFFRLQKRNWVIEDTLQYVNFTHHVLKRSNGEGQYLNLIENLMYTGSIRKGRNAVVLSSFHKNLSFDLREGFPLLTTKNMFFRGIVEELLFFIRGDTDTKILEQKGVNIWKGNTSREFLDNKRMITVCEGMMGPMYGYLWRNYGAEYDFSTGKPKEFTPSGIDQLSNVVDSILTDPMSRRHLISTYDAKIANDGVLYPCHSLILQFYVHEEHEENGKKQYLDMFCYIRSSDTFLGLPFNIASSAILLSLVAKVTNKEPRFLHITLGDAHIYEEHLSAIEEQIKRWPYKFPRLEIKKDIRTVKDMENLVFEDFYIEGYNCYPAIKARMIA